MAELSARRLRFVQEYAIDGNGAQAAIRAGYSPGCAKVTASRLLTDANVLAAIANLQDEVAEKHEVTVESIAAELEQDRQAAHHAGQIGAAVSATMGKAKLYGLIVNKHENVNELTAAERERRIHELLDARERARADGAARAGQEGSRPEPAQPLPALSEAAPVSQRRH